MSNKIGIFTEEQYADRMRHQVSNSGIGSTAGLEQAIETTTQIVSGVVNTLYYELMGQKLSDFVKIEVGTGAYSLNLFQYASAYVGDPFKSGLIEPTASGINADANSNIKIGSLRTFCRVLSIFKNTSYFILFFWLCWVFIAVIRLSVVVVSMDYSLFVVHGLLVVVASLVLVGGFQ